MSEEIRGFTYLTALSHSDSNRTVKYIFQSALNIPKSHRTTGVFYKNTKIFNDNVNSAWKEVMSSNEYRLISEFHQSEFGQETLTMHATKEGISFMFQDSNLIISVF